MTELLLGLVDKLIQLATERRETNRQLYADFVEPTMSDFDMVHRDYLDSLGRYRLLLSDRSEEIRSEHPVFSAIQADNLLSDGLRAKLWALYEGVSPDCPTHQFFMVAILRYLMNVRSELDPTPSRGQREQYIRQNLADRLHYITTFDFEDCDRRTLALNEIDDLIGGLQHNYRQVVRQHLTLKSTLLRPSRF